MYFDSHAHLDDARFQPDFDDILARMRENGVTGMMNIGCDLPSSERSVALAERYGVEVRYVTEETQTAVGEASLTLYPPVGEGGENELGLTILCSAGEFDTLITGDMDSRTERVLVSSYPLPDIEVLLVGHHGSRYSTSGELLSAVMPEVGVVSVGSNSYGHPTRDALLRLTDAGVTVYRTDLQGNIYITVN